MAIEKIEGHDDLVDEITGLLGKAHLNEADLDDEIHDIADHFGVINANEEEEEDEEKQDAAIDETSHQGSDINNEGMEAQVRAILAFHGLKDGVQRLNEIVEEITGETNLIPVPKEE